jgi:transcriptional regulator with XRE-family HTH domain
MRRFKVKIKREDLVPAGGSILMSPGEMVRALRVLKGWSQLDLEDASGISQTNISAIENGRVQVGKERSIALAEALSVHPSSIMFADYEESVA